MGRQAGQRSPAGAPRVDDCQSGLRARAAVIRGAGDGAFYREIPREMGRARLALSALDREAGGPLGETDRQSTEAKRITRRQQ